MHLIDLSIVVVCALSADDIIAFAVSFMPVKADARMRIDGHSRVHLDHSFFFFWKQVFDVDPSLSAGAVLKMLCLIYHMMFTSRLFYHSFIREKTVHTISRE